MKVDFKFENGNEVRDIVSGFTGIIDCSSLWLNGCRRYSIQPKMKEGDSNKPESLWMDEETLELISDGVVKSITPTKTGGPSFSSENAKF